MLKKYSIATNGFAFKCSKASRCIVGFALGWRQRFLQQAFQSVGLLINLITLVCFKAALVQTLFALEYGGLDLFLQTEKQSYLERLLSPCLNCKNNSREKQRPFCSA